MSDSGYKSYLVLLGESQGRLRSFSDILNRSVAIPGIGFVLPSVNCCRRTTMNRTSVLFLQEKSWAKHATSVVWVVTFHLAVLYRMKYRRRGTPDQILQILGIYGVGPYITHLVQQEGRFYRETQECGRNGRKTRRILTFELGVS